MTILFAYDGSESSDHALREAATIVGPGGSEAVVLSVWEPLVVEALRTPAVAALEVPSNVGEIDDRSEQQAQRLAEHGAKLAGELGFKARPLWEADEKNIAEAIVARADEIDADLVVLGARGLAGVRAYIGSVSNHVVQHAKRPVLVIPADKAAEQDPS
jgi:nucleotide-binding universal stress UspA family protein